MTSALRKRAADQFGIVHQVVYVIEVSNLIGIDTACGIRSKWIDRINKPDKNAMTHVERDDVTCMACLVKGARR